MPSQEPAPGHSGKLRRIPPGLLKATILPLRLLLCLPVHV